MFFILSSLTFKSLSIGFNCSCCFSNNSFIILVDVRNELGISSIFLSPLNTFITSSQYDIALTVVALLKTWSLKPALTSLYISLSKSLENISNSFLELLTRPSTFLSSFLVWSSNLPPDLNLDTNSSNPLNVKALTPVFHWLNFQESYLGIPVLAKTLSAPFDMFLKADGNISL